MKSIMITLKIFLIGGLLIISNGNLALADSDNLHVFFERYTAWVTELFGKGTIVVGYVVSTEWLPDVHSNYTTVQG